MVHISCLVSHAISKTVLMSGTYENPLLIFTEVVYKKKRLPLRGGQFGFREQGDYFWLDFKPFLAPEILNFLGTCFCKIFSCL